MLEDIHVEDIRKQTRPVTYAHLANEPSTCGWMIFTQLLIVI